MCGFICIMGMDKLEREMSFPSSHVHHPLRSAMVWGCPRLLYNRESSVASCDYSKTMRTSIMAIAHKPTCLSTCFSILLFSSATSASFSSDKNWSLEIEGPSPVWYPSLSPDLGGVVSKWREGKSEDLHF